MFYLTPKNSVTGKKFQAIVDKRKACFAATNALLDELGTKVYRQSRISVWGGISSIIFSKPPDKNVWKQVRGGADEWMPKKTSKEGKELAKRIEALPIVTHNELNEIVGYKSHFFGHIGFASEGKKHFGFTTGSDWEVKIPADCEEVTETQYRKATNLK